MESVTKQKPTDMQYLLDSERAGNRLNTLTASRCVGFSANCKREFTSSNAVDCNRLRESHWCRRSSAQACTTWKRDGLGPRLALRSIILGVIPGISGRSWFGASRPTADQLGLAFDDIVWIPPTISLSTYCLFKTSQHTHIDQQSRCSNVNGSR